MRIVEFSFPLKASARHPELLLASWQEEVEEEEENTTQRRELTQRSYRLTSFLLLTLFPPLCLGLKREKRGQKNELWKEEKERTWSSCCLCRRHCLLGGREWVSFNNGWKPSANLILFLFFSSLFYLTACSPLSWWKENASWFGAQMTRPKEWHCEWYSRYSVYAKCNLAHSSWLNTRVLTWVHEHWYIHPSIHHSVYHSRHLNARKSHLLGEIAD